MNSPILQIQDTSFSYDQGNVLHSISMDFKPGEFVGVIGPNGSGKSTLLKILGGVLTSNFGELFFKGKNFVDFNRKELARSITWIPQDHPMVFPFKVSEVVLMGRHPHLSALSFESHEDFNISQRAMKTTMTSEFSERFFNEISEGEKQRVMIASALAQKPELMLLDEPTSALDLKYQIEIMNILKDLNANHKMTLIVAMHDLNLASRFCNRIILINEGKVVSDGTPLKVLKKDILEQVYGIELDLDFKNGHTLIHPKIDS